MFNRLLASFGLALAGFIASTGLSAAAWIETRSEVMYLTGAVIVVVLVIFSLGAGLKHAFGLDKMPPPPADDGQGGHH